MGTSTAYLQLFKPDTNDTITVSTNLSDNLELIDDAVADLNSAHARYYNDAIQTVATGAITKCKFPDSSVTHARITADAAFETFTVLDAGLYIVEACIAWVPGTGVRNIEIRKVNGTANTLVENSNTTTADSVNLSASTVKRLDANDQLSVYIYQTNGSDLNTLPGTERIHFSITRMRA